MNAEIFKAYDIRGIVGKTLSAEVAYWIGLALAAKAQQRGVTKITVGRDGRHSGPELSIALITGLRRGGLAVIDLNQVTTPMVYFSSYYLKTGSGVAITGSHNPPDYNGFKIMLAGETLFGEDLQDLRRWIEVHQDAAAPMSIYPSYLKILSCERSCGRIAALQSLDGVNDPSTFCALHCIPQSSLANPVPSGTKGIDLTDPLSPLESFDIADAYIQKIVEDIHLKHPIKVAIDCGNGVAGKIAPTLFKAIGCEVTPLFCEVDGDFPNHHPDPADPKNLQDLIKCLAHSDAQLGLAFDGDGDRLGVVTKNGQIIWPDRQLILFARSVLAQHPGKQIIYDVKCSRHVANAVNAAGGEPLMWKTGHSLIKAKLKETAAPLAGEMSGHVFFNDRWYGFDDGLYAAARLLEILSADEQHTPTQILNSLPDAISTPELKLNTEEGEHFSLVSRLKDYLLEQLASSAFAAGHPFTLLTIDGVRLDYADGFALARPSNTTPSVVLRFEADTQIALTRIQNDFRAAIEAIAPHVILPF